MSLFKKVSFLFLTSSSVLLGLIFLMPEYRKTVLNYPPSDNDYLKLKKQVIKKSNASIPIFREVNPSSKNRAKFQDFFEENKLDILMIGSSKNVTIEIYKEGYSANTLISIWSLTKVFVGCLMDLAIKDGYIDDIEVPIVKLLPELKNKISNNVRIKHLLNMTSGINYSSNKIMDLRPYINVHYGSDLHKYMMKSKSVIEPGREYNYSQMDLMISMCLLRRSLDMPLTKYMKIKIWDYIDPISEAYWLVDDTNEKLERAASGLFVTGEDMIKFAQLYLNRGRHNGKSVLDEEYINDCFLNENTDFQFMKNFWKHSYLNVDNPEVISSKSTSESIGKKAIGNIYVNGANNNKLLYIFPEKDMVVFCSSSGLLNKDIVNDINLIINN